MLCSEEKSLAGILFQFIQYKKLVSLPLLACLAVTVMAALFCKMEILCEIDISWHMALIFMVHLSTHVKFTRGACQEHESSVWNLAAKSVNWGMYYTQHRQPIKGGNLPLYLSLVRSHLKYFCTVLGSQYKEDVKVLESIQKRA